MSGHLILNPAGEEIRVPNHAINTLKLLKVTVFNRKRRLRQITEAIFPLLKREYDTITSGKESYKGNGLRLVLGPDCSGPDWCQCECKKCSKLEEDTDTTASPFGAQSFAAVRCQDCGVWYVPTNEADEGTEHKTCQRGGG